MKALILPLLLIATSARCLGQTLPPGIPPSFEACQTGNKQQECGTWVWSGDHFDITWEGDPPATAIIESVSRDDVVFKATYKEPDGGPPTVTAIYNGKLGAGGMVGGESYYYQNGILKMSGRWSTVINLHQPDAQQQQAAQAKAKLEEERAKEAAKTLIKAADAKAFAILMESWSAIHAPAPTPSCDPSNPQHKTPEEALELHRIAHQNGDEGTAACWAYISAVRGNSQAQGVYGYELLMGNGVAKDVRQARLSLKFGTVNGNLQADHNLGFIYTGGLGVPVDTLKANYWYARERIDKQHSESAGTSQYCDIDNPQNLSADEIDKLLLASMEVMDARGVYCWAVLGAELKSPLSEGVMGEILMQDQTYFERDWDRAFALLTDSAAHEDPFGEYFLAKAYHYGVGTPMMNEKKHDYWYAKSQETDRGRQVAALDKAADDKSFDAAVAEFFTSAPGPTQEEKDAAMGRSERQLLWMQKQEAIRKGAPIF